MLHIDKSGCSTIVDVKFGSISNLVSLRTSTRSRHRQPWIDFGTGFRVPKDPVVADEESNDGVLDVYVGGVGSLNADGEWDSHFDVSVYSERRFGQRWPSPIFEARYAGVAALSNPEEASMMRTPMENTDPAMTSETDAEIASPFDLPGRMARVDIGVDVPFRKWDEMKDYSVALGLRVGLGTTQDATELLRDEAQGSAGRRLRL